MSKRIVSLLLAVLLLYTVPALAEITVTDMYGRKIALDEPATRIVALTAADCEILCALGCEELLIGRGEFCDYPESILDVPVAQSGAGTNLEQLLMLQPQVVLMGDMAQDKAIVDALEDNGIRVVVSDAESIQATYTAIRMIGEVTGKTAEAEALVANMQDTFSGIAATAENTGKTVYFEVSPLPWGLWTAGANTFMDELAQMCGLTNAFADVQGWPEVSEEQVLLRDPDYIVTITMPSDFIPVPVDEIAGRTGWEGVTAVTNGDILNIDPDIVSRPGPRLMEAADQISKFIRSAD